MVHVKTSWQINQTYKLLIKKKLLKRQISLLICNEFMSAFINCSHVVAPISRMICFLIGVMPSGYNFKIFQKFSKTNFNLKHEHLVNEMLWQKRSSINNLAQQRQWQTKFPTKHSSSHSQPLLNPRIRPLQPLESSWWKTCNEETKLFWDTLLPPE